MWQNDARKKHCFLAMPLLKTWQACSRAPKARARKFWLFGLKCSNDMSEIMLDNESPRRDRPVWSALCKNEHCNICITTIWTPRFSSLATKLCCKCTHGYQGHTKPFMPRMLGKGKNSKFIRSAADYLWYFGLNLKLVPKWRAQNGVLFGRTPAKNTQRARKIWRFLAEK